MTESITILLSLSSSPSTPRIPVKLSKKTNVSDFRTIVSDATKIPLTNLKLIYRGRMIKSDDSYVIETYNIEDSCVVHCMGKPLQDNIKSSVDAPAPISSGASFTTTPSSSQATTQSIEENTLGSAIALLKSSSDPKTSFATIIKIISNILSHPMEEKYRSIKSTNAAFQKRLGSKTGGNECMLALGFVKNESEEYTITPTPEAWNYLLSSKVLLEKELSSLQQQQQPYTPSYTPEQQVLNNPQMMQSMLNNPQMMQRMQGMMNDPQMMQRMQSMMNDPQMMQRMQGMMNNPQMRQRMQGMMNDPQMMQNMMNANRPGGAPPDFNQMEEMLRLFQSNARPAGEETQSNVNSNTRGQQQQQNQQDESSMTEEEMIAEAIARSLREN